ncbi:MAG: polyphosphate polymerase domain-containing protein [Planctomycetaceae bacterium]
MSMMVKSNSSRSGNDPCLQVIDNESSRSDLASRREVKFVFPGADVAKLRRLMECNGRRVIHQGPVSEVRSIYFDSPQLSACQANLSGVSQRRKTRLRWYDSLVPGDEAYFEIKWRENQMTGKYRLKMQASPQLGAWSYRQLVGGLLDTLPSDHVGRFLAGCDPVAIVEYRREHFVSPDGHLRATLDFDLAFYDQTGKQRINTTFPRRMPGLVVLEVKADPKRVVELRELLFPLNPRVGRCSKYVHACRALGLIGSAD